MATAPRRPASLPSALFCSLISSGVRACQWPACKHIYNTIAAALRCDTCLVQELLRNSEKAGGSRDAFSLTDLKPSKAYFPSREELLHAVMAVDNHMDAHPYWVSYPDHGNQLECPGKYCGWNGQNIRVNKGSFFYVIDDLNHMGFFDKEPVAEWEKQILFAIAMQVGPHCTSIALCCVTSPQLASRQPISTLSSTIAFISVNLAGN